MYYFKIFYCIIHHGLNFSFVAYKIGKQFIGERLYDTFLILIAGYSSMYFMNLLDTFKINSLMKRFLREIICTSSSNCFPTNQKLKFYIWFSISKRNFLFANEWKYLHKWDNKALHSFFIPLDVTSSNLRVRSTALDILLASTYLYLDDYAKFPFVWTFLQFFHLECTLHC